MGGVTTLHTPAPLQTQVPPPSIRLQRSLPKGESALQIAALAGLIARQQLGGGPASTGALESISGAPLSLQRASRDHAQDVPSLTIAQRSGPSASSPSHMPWFAGANALQQEFDTGTSNGGAAVSAGGVATSMGGTAASPDESGAARSVTTSLVAGMVSAHAKDSPANAANNAPDAIPRRRPDAWDKTTRTDSWQCSGIGWWLLRRRMNR
jgi:hypothetical protein